MKRQGNDAGYCDRDNHRSVHKTIDPAAGFGIKAVKQIKRIELAKRRLHSVVERLSKDQASNRRVVLIKFRIKHVHINWSQTDGVEIHVLAEARLDVHRHGHAVPKAHLAAVENEELIDFSTVVEFLLSTAAGDALVELRDSRRDT